MFTVTLSPGPARGIALLTLENPPVNAFSPGVAGAVMLSASIGQFFTGAVSSFGLAQAALFTVGGIAFERADGNGFIDLATAAGIFAKVDAYPAQYAGKRHFFPDNGVGFISAAQGSPTNADPINFSVDFGEVVSGFDAAEITAYKARSYEIPMEPVTTSSRAVREDRARPRARRR